MEALKRLVPSFPLAVLIGAVSAPVGAVALDSLGVLNLVSNGFPVNISTFADIIGAFGSVSLTLALVLLYREQTKIQRRQEEWMEAEHVPDVFVHEWELTQDRVLLSLSNLGTGVARNLRVEIAITTADRYGVSEVTFGARVSRQPSSAQVLRPDENDTTEVRGYLKPEGLTGVSDATQLSVDEALTWLNSEDSPVNVVVRLNYDYIRRRSGSQIVFSSPADPQDAKTIEELLLSTDRRTEGWSETPPTNLTESAETL